jgi:PBP1b-binding outer membrane lipoprotein LpoB
MQMKKISALCALAISLLAGCATDGGKETSKAAPVAAAPAPAPVESKPAAIDSTIAWRKGKEQDLAEAQSLASKAQSMKIPVTVKTARAQKRDEAYNKTDQLDAVRNVVLRPLALDKINKDDKIWAEVVRQMGKHAAQASVHEPQQIVVSTTKSIKVRVTQWLNEGIASANNAQKPDIQVFDTNLAKDTAIFYQPLDQKQFTN